MDLEVRVWERERERERTNKCHMKRKVNHMANRVPFEHLFVPKTVLPKESDLDEEKVIRRRISFVVNCEWDFVVHESITFFPPEPSFLILCLR